MLWLILACADPPQEPVATYTPDWPGVEAFLEEQCVSCHQDGGGTTITFPEGLLIDLWLESGTLVVAGDPDASRLWRVISGNAGAEDAGTMPLTGLLAPETVAHVEAWIVAGAEGPLPEDNDGDGFAAVIEDCDDTDENRYPGATETCDGIDNDCSGVVDDVVGVTFADGDGDGAGDPLQPLSACDPEGVAVGDDCDDDDAERFPGADERCDGIDNDCDGIVDPETSVDAGLWYADFDGDGYGSDTNLLTTCETPVGYVGAPGDCDDTRSFVSPLGKERCNGLDDDCNGVIDDGVAMPSWYPDQDNDGFGAGTPILACVQPAGHAAYDGDCDDGDSNYYPSAPEPVCQQPFDYNCDGFTGAGDADGDGFSACEDCDDGDDTRYPGAEEDCDGLDDDCDGAVDEEAVDATAYFVDADGDGQGADPIQACTLVWGLSANDDDCDDTDPLAFVGAVEQCNGVDDDCDGSVDEQAAGNQTTYADTDGDGYGDPNVTNVGCGSSGFVAIAGDCDDTDPLVYPGVDDVLDGVDNDCDGLVDEDASIVPDYDAQIQPIWDARCTSGCHGSTNPAGGLSLLTGSRANLVGVPAGQLPSMDLVSPGSVDESYLWHKIQNTHQDVGGSGSRMPKFGSGLTQGQQDLVQDWILGGAP